jgi:hypothetical protein
MSDVNEPLGIKIYGHKLETGGYLIGPGASCLSGADVHGWAAGVDVAFEF